MTEVDVDADIWKEDRNLLSIHPLEDLNGFNIFHLPTFVLLHKSFVDAIFSPAGWNVLKVEGSLRAPENETFRVYLGHTGLGHVAVSGTSRQGWDMGWV